MLLKKYKRKKDRKLLNEIKSQDCIICETSPCDPAHIKSVKSGGDDVEHNVVPLCRVHHREQHDIGHYRFALRYPKYNDVLNKKGWEWNGTKPIYLKKSSLKTSEGFSEIQNSDTQLSKDQELKEKLATCEAVESNFIVSVIAIGKLYHFLRRLERFLIMFSF